MKNGGEDVVFLPPATVEMLRAYVGERTTGPLFLASHGGRLTARSVHRRLCEWAERAGIAGRVHPHRLRHTFGTRLFRTTGNVLLVARAMSHRSVASTAIYVRVDSASVRAAVHGGWRQGTRGIPEMRWATRPLPRRDDAGLRLALMA
jgi:integrase